MSRNAKVVCVIVVLVLLYTVMSGKSSNSATRQTPSIIANPAVAEQGPVVM